MKTYKSHKTVQAAKIVHIYHNALTSILHFEGGSWREVQPEYISKHKPECGGYYVCYADGYESFSPAKAFEEGHTETDPDKEGKVIRETTFVERLIEEFSQLNERVNKLHSFLGSTPFYNLDEDNRADLHLQYGCMVEYRKVLQRRIERLQANS